MRFRPARVETEFFPLRNPGRYANYAEGFYTNAPAYIYSNKNNDNINTRDGFYYAVREEFSPICQPSRESIIITVHIISCWNVRPWPVSMKYRSIRQETECHSRILSHHCIGNIGMPDCIMKIKKKNTFSADRKGCK